jgi:hypothetical protein
MFLKTSKQKNGRINLSFAHDLAYNIAYITSL